MNALTDSQGLWLAAASLLIVVAAVVCASLLWRRSERRQARLEGRLRQDAARQSEAVARLSEGLNVALRQIEALSDSMEMRQDRLRRTLDERMELMNRTNEHRLEQMQGLVTEKLDSRLNESFQTVNGQLAGVHRGLGEMRELAMGIGDLQKMLGGVKTRGVWGEVQLGTLLEQLFAPGQLAVNVAIPEGSQTRVEFVLRIPAGEGERLLPIDAKFPQEDYLRLVEASEAGDAGEARRCAAQLERAVMEQARRIHDKYIHPPLTADFAVMFLPTESLYAEIARRDGLIQRAQERYRVLISGPATLCALLTSVQMGMRSVTLERRSGEVLNMLAGMKREFAGFEVAVQRMRQRLAQAGTELDALERQSRKAVRALEAMDEREGSET